MKRFMIGSGWKMNNTIAASTALIKGLQANLAGFNDFPIFVLPSFTSLPAVKELLAGDKVIRYGAQNMHWDDGGAFTGEISAPMLTELDCTYVELNHQERRALFGETNQTTNKKVLAALRWNLQPILCLGEEEILDDEQLYAFLREQICEMLAGVEAQAVPRIIFAYEPRWAIGKTEAAPPSHVAKVHRIIRNVLRDLYGQAVAEQAYVIYGGSVDKNNAVEIALQPGVDGLFIGRSGLQAEVFSGIIKDVAAALKK